jgi:hypothetical protein
VGRALAHPALGETVKAELRRLRRTADPVLVPAEVRAAQAELGRRVDARGLAPAAAAPTPAVEQLIADLGTAWREGERRPTHRRPYHRVEPMPRRPSALADVRDEIAAWLAAAPELTGFGVRERLDRLDPGRFATLSQRTIQRAVKAVRATQARGVVAETAALLGGDPPVDLLDDADASPTAPHAQPQQPPPSDIEIAGNIRR